MKGDVAAQNPKRTCLSSKRNRTCLQLSILLCCTIFAAGCGHRTYQTQAPAPVPQPSVAGQPAPSSASGPPPAIEGQTARPGEYVEEGVASWYGPTFNGRRTSDGEIYDMHDFTAAHRTLPFNAVVRVTNMSNGLQTQVRINDRGPFVANRIIDLSLSAAKALEMVGPGTAQVRLEMMSGPDPDTGFFAVQVGAFQMQGNADRLRAQLTERYSPVVTVPFDLPTGHFYRVRVGRLPTEAAARALADQLRDAGLLITFVVRLDK
ncbi:MAG TPA: septal ring lytic transglycosylase RlpA family protein [Candidatus Acidoferrales bacterium]|nr:septal ring lytic transglycosylase RlpA family protein [Candidatus Acidoferrales bacterium]